jgi:iron(III) transport system ATP-binding protein
VTIASSIEFRNVSHHFAERQTLNNVSIEAAPGDVLCLLGPSGSGKTTLLRLAAGLARPSGGEVLINRRVVSTSDRIQPPEKRGVGLVFQDFALFPHLTILQNVEFGLTQLGKAERRKHAMRMLETVGIGHESEKYPHALSGGEQQRVALARALAPKPGILLMDEPFSGLDARLRESVREETLNLLRATRSTVLIVTHDPEEAMKIADKIALMQDGRIVQSGTCDELYNHPNCLFSARFFTELNALPAVLSGDRVETALGSVPLPPEVLAKNSGNLLACVRPNDFEIELVDPAKLPKPPSDNRAFIKNRRFLGEMQQLEVVHSGSDQILHLRCAPGTIPDNVLEIDIHLLPEKVMVFDA